MENDKDIKIETEEDLGLDDKIKAKAKAKALGKKIGEPVCGIGSEYNTEKTIERVED